MTQHSLLPGLAEWSEKLLELRRSRDVPIIMVTARGDESDRVLGLEIGADDYLTKPFDFKELLLRIKAVINKRNASQSNDLLGSLVDGVRRQRTDQRSGGPAPG